MKPDTSKCLGFLALGPRALPTAAKPPAPCRLGLGWAFCTGPSWPGQGIYSCSQPPAPGSASRLKGLDRARRTGLGDCPGQGAKRQDVREASWHPSVGAWLGQPDAGPTTASPHSRERGSVTPASHEKTEAQEVKQCA